jgi:hypothetical protein
LQQSRDQTPRAYEAIKDRLDNVERALARVTQRLRILEGGGDLAPIRGQGVERRGPRERRG